MAVKRDAWAVAQTAMEKVPGPLGPDDLTAQRFAERNNISKHRAKGILEGLVADGLMVTQDRRGKTGLVKVYMLKES